MLSKLTRNDCEEQCKHIVLFLRRTQREAHTIQRDLNWIRMYVYVSTYVGLQYTHTLQIASTLSKDLGKNMILYPMYLYLLRKSSRQSNWESILIGIRYGYDYQTGLNIDRLCHSPPELTIHSRGKGTNSGLIEQKLKTQGVKK